MERTNFVLENLKGKILDVGFSVGKMHERIKRHFGNENVFGLDVIFRWNVEGNYVLASAEAMPFKEESFDSIFAGELIEHLYNPNKFFLESARILKKYGILIITTPNKKSLINRLFHSYEKPAHLNLFSFPEIKELLEKNNFIIKKHFYLPFTEESSEGSRFKALFFLRKMLHFILPESLQEDIIILAEKVS